MISVVFSVKSYARNPKQGTCLSSWVMSRNPLGIGISNPYTVLLSMTKPTDVLALPTVQFLIAQCSMQKWGGKACSILSCE